VDPRGKGEPRPRADGERRMINFVTVHWMSEKWVPIQLAYLDRNVNAPYRVFASLNGIDDQSVRRRFHYVEDVEGKHGDKLNVLSERVIEQSEPEDFLVFLDGDAFPIQPMQPWLDEALRRYPLVAVQRRENCEDVRAHPSFCATTVGFWKELGCDWTYTDWITPTGELFNDAGGKLATLLETQGIEWLPLLRSNTHNPHPLWYGVYGHRVYHHGAGFRARVSKVDQVNIPALNKEVSTRNEVSLGQLSVAVRRRPSLLLRIRPRHLQRLARAAQRTVLGRLTRRFAAKAEAESDDVFDRIVSDKRFYRSFDSTVP
jgi:hypothetical protein